MQSVLDALRRLRISHAIVAIATAVLAVGVTIVIEPGPGPTPHNKVTITLGGPGHQVVPAPPVATQVQAAAGLADHQGARDETPPGVPATQIEAAREQQDQLAQTDQLPIVAPDAAPSQQGCTSRFVQNFSSRRGVRPRLLVAHYTVSHNTPGWGDVWAIVHFFDIPSVQASSNDVIDAEGHCAYIVREVDKAWAQATANPLALSTEFVDYGTEGGLSPAQLAKGGQVFAQEAKRWQIPIQLGEVRNCVLVRPGIVDHAMLGPCGGGHHDLQPFGGTPIQVDAALTPTDIANAHKRLDPLIAATKRAASATGVAVDASATVKTWCRKLNWWRTHGRPHGGKAEANAVRRRQLLANHRYVCTSRGPVVA
jgi:hypothetical protein